MKKKMNSKKGFTLVEIIVVLVILAIMAGFAIPAYNGFVERARQAEILADARVVLIAAQTAGQEKYALAGRDLVGEAGTNSADEIAILAKIAAYSEIPSDSTTKKYEVVYSVDGKVTDVLYFDGTYLATYAAGEWNIVKNTAATVTTAAIVAPRT